MDVVAMLALAVALVAGAPLATACSSAAGPEPVRSTAAHLAGVTGAVLVGSAISYGVARLLTGGGDDPGSSGLGAFYTWAVVAGLLFLAVDAVVRRDARQPVGAPAPGLDGRVEEALARGVLDVLARPAPVVLLLAVGEVLVLGGSRLWQAWPFWVLAVALAAVPLVALLATGDRSGGSVPSLGEAVARIAWLIRVAVPVFVVAVLVV